MEDEDAANYPEDVAMFEEDLDAVKRDTVGFGAEKEFFKQYLKIAKGGPVKGKPVEPRCELCQRHFQGETEKTHFIRRLEKLISSPERQVPEGELESFQERLTKAREANPSYVTWLRLKEEDIPKLEKECRNDESRREDLLRKAEEHDQVVKEKEAAKREIEALSKTVQSILRYHTELHQLQTQIQELSKKRQDTGLSRGLEDIQNDSKKLNEQLRELKARTTQLLNERDRGRSQVHQLEAEVNQMRTKLSTAIFKLKEKSNFMSQMEELKSFNTEQREDIRQADQDIQALAPQISQAQAKYDDIEKRGNDRQRELNQDASKISDSLNQLRLADQEVNSYLGRGGDSQLHHAEMEIKHLEEEVIKREDKQRHVIAEIKKIDDTLRNTADMKRQISDNLRYRAGARNLQSVRGEIEELESHNAYADKERYEREGNRWQNERNKLSAEQASTVGTLKSKDDQLAGLLKDWETDYQDAAYKYREAHIKVETTKAVVEDLGRYGGALDKAIMRYHGLKMEEINRIIEELWKKTYQGTDVDTIIIRSDNENVKGNKSYNYRVCMVKQDAEMDMRGRCSAGQKVLASIIIRLALAECFGVNCGLIALDEPTTNLDRDNIKALAESLAEIIRVRRQQSNFQLIVITHDEEFLRHMQCADFSDTYYRVSRNERQKSIIERQSIAEVV
ncbi:hypothetical protein M501DRAFT_1024242 [Patellaria atrata CBS 101060]|uniref:Uncharacterized protein n=1 Tax=Patellaria atrata CBS 101060 TaxID=1346257 RepID=A0A9P4VRD6_9PEZI|nr:hypothetical protein M501DRAFT_1024242 [Patellaria atrata CBS 101060]